MRDFVGESRRRRKKSFFFLSLTSLSAISVSFPPFFRGQDFWTPFSEEIHFIFLLFILREEIYDGKEQF